MPCPIGRVENHHTVVRQILGERSGGDRRAPKTARRETSPPRDTRLLTLVRRWPRAPGAGGHGRQVGGVYCWLGLRRSNRKVVEGSAGCEQPNTNTATRSSRFTGDGPRRPCRSETWSGRGHSRLGSSGDRRHWQLEPAWPLLTLPKSERPDEWLGGETESWP